MDPTSTIKETEFPAKPDLDSMSSDQPEWRMGNAAKLLELVRAADNSPDRARFLDVCAEVDDMYDRKPPDDPGELALDGLGWSNNVDWGGMEFGIDSAIAPEFNLLHMPETYIRLETVYNGVDLSDQKRTVEHEDKRMLDEWEEWIPELGKMLLQRKKYGLGIFYFRHPRSWQFQSLHPGNLLTSSPTMNPAKWSWCGIHTSFDISDLLKKLDDKGKADEHGFSDTGWNKEAIKKAIKEHCKDKTDFQFLHYDAENWRNEYLANDIYYGYKNDMSIPGYIVYVREFDGTVTEYLISQKSEVGFLYRSPKKQRLAQMSEAFCMFPEHCGQNLFREVRGYGIKNMGFFDAENQMNNRLLDSAYLSSSLFITGGTPDDLYNQQEIMFGPFTMMPSNLSLSASNMPNVAQNFTPIMSHLNQMRMNASYVTGGDGEGPDRQTATAAKINFQKGQRMQNYSINFLYSLAEKFHRLRFDRYSKDKGMLKTDPGYKEREEAMERMQVKGVTDDFLAAIDRKATKICRIFGDGDPAKLFADAMDLMPTLGAMTESGKKDYFRDLAHAKMGHDRAVAYFGDQTQDPTVLQNRSKAQLENGHFESSDAKIDSAGDDNHFVHLSEHVPFLESKVAAMQEGGAAPEDIFKTLSRAMAHIGFNEDAQPVGGHILPLFEDPAAGQMAQEFTQRMADLINLRRQIGQQMQAQQQANQQKQLQDLKMPLEEQAKAQKIQGQIKTDAEKASIEIEKGKMELEFMERKHELELRKLQAEVDAALVRDTRKEAE